MKRFYFSLFSSSAPSFHFLFLLFFLLPPHFLHSLSSSLPLSSLRTFLFSTLPPFIPLFLLRALNSYFHSFLPPHLFCSDLLSFLHPFRVPTSIPFFLLISSVPTFLPSSISSVFPPLFISSLSWAS